MFAFQSWACCAQANIYIAQDATGANTGSDCADAYAAAFFNTAGNWGPGSAQIGPGTTVHLCGTISSSLIAQGNGSSGAVITILFELGSRLSQPICNAAPCLGLNNRSFITVDGGSNGIIENTQNGTTLANHVPSHGIDANPCNNCEIKNLTIQNIYVHSGTNNEVDQTAVRCITFSGSNILIHDNVMHDAGWCIIDSFASGDSNVMVYNNNIYNIDHGFTPSTGGTPTAGPFYFFNNHVHDYANWDTTINAYHHDGIHCFASPGPAHISGGLWIYNNVFDGDIGNNVTGHIFLEGGTGPGRTPCLDASSTVKVFNNVFIANHISSGLVQLYNGTAIEVYNNTIEQIAGGSGGTCLQLGGGSPSTLSKIENNIFSGCDVLIDLTTTFSNISSDLNHNVYSNCASFNCFVISGLSVDTGSFSTYRSKCSCDVNSAFSPTPVTDSSGRIGATSLAAKAGVDLSSVGFQALDSDRTGDPRPLSPAPWDVGAYDVNTNRPNAPPQSTAVVR